jgi:molybdopterin-binding protein
MANSRTKPRQGAETVTAPKALRARLGLAQRELAELVGVHAMTVSKWERGVLDPSPHQRRILRALADAAERGRHAEPERGRRAKPAGRSDPVRLLSDLLAHAYARPEINLGTLSATNRFAGRIVELVRGDVMSKVVIEVTDEVQIGAVITTDSVDRLGLAVGGHAIAIIKATEVIVGGG